MKKLSQLLVILFALGVLMGSSCNKVTPPPVVIQPDDTADCPAACAHLKKLGCEEGSDLEDGTTCTKFCEETQKKGHALAPSCVVTIKTCAELEPKCNKPRQIVK